MHGEWKQIGGCLGGGGVTAEGHRFSLGVMGSIRQWQWPHNAVNVLNATEIYT